MAVIKRNHIEAYLRREKKRFEETLCRWVEVPSVSMDPSHRPDIQRAADLAVRTLKAAGAEASKVMTPGYPVVWGRFLKDPRYPTVTVYNHLDVQPANEPEWKQSPFHFKIRGNRYLGRGATDDKGPALTALMAARYAVENRVPLNIQFIWELEEEIGSPHFEDFLKKKHRDLKTDSVLVSDTIWMAKGRPAIPYGLRGLLTARLVLKTASKDAHSGLTGGAACNPLTEICQIISACYDAKSGRVKIPGFYDDVLPVSRREIKGFSSSGFSVSRFMKAYGLRYLKVTNRLEVMRRVWAQPTFEIHGVSGGYQGPGIKTAIPSEAEAKISMRLVPHQDPRRVFTMLRRFVQKINPHVNVIAGGFLRPYRGQSGGPYTEAARRAFQFAFRQEPAFVREGGSIGAVLTMEQYLKVPIIFMGLSLPEHGYHAPNEYFDWGQAAGGVKAFVKYFDDISRI